MKKRPLKNLDEVKIIVLAKDGNQQAFAELHARFNKSLQYFIKAKLKVEDDEVIEDFAQQTFIQAFKNIQSFEPKFRITTWLYRIASNMIIDFHRKKAFKRSNGELVSITFTDEDGQETTSQFEDSRLTPDMEMERDQRSDFVKELIENKLPSSLQEVIRLRFYEEKSYEEIAEILEIPLGTAKARIHRAKAVLGQALKQKMPEFV